MQFTDDDGVQWFVRPASVTAFAVVNSGKDGSARYAISVTVHSLAMPIMYGRYHNRNALLEDFSRDMDNASR